MSEEEKKIEIVSGKVDDLEISQVYEHLNIAKPKTAGETKSNIVIPEVKENTEEKEEQEESSDKEEKQEESESSSEE